MQYLMWENDYHEGFCVVRSPDVEDAWQLDEGVPRQDTWPTDVECEMDPDYPNDLELSDNLYGNEFYIVSERVKKIIEAEATHDRVEFLPVAIRNHKGRLESERYYLLHPLDCVDCIDIDASGVEWNEITSDLIARMKGLVLKEDAIPPEKKIFRMKYMGFVILAREDLVNTLEQAGVHGLAFRETEGYTGI